MTMTKRSRSKSAGADDAEVLTGEKVGDRLAMVVLGHGIHCFIFSLVNSSLWRLWQVFVLKNDL